MSFFYGFVVKATLIYLSTTPLILILRSEGQIKCFMKYIATKCLTNSLLINTLYVNILGIIYLVC